jgi:hypothetical protein
MGHSVSSAATRVTRKVGRRRRDGSPDAPERPPQAFGAGGVPSRQPNPGCDEAMRRPGASVCADPAASPGRSLRPDSAGRSVSRVVEGLGGSVEFREGTNGRSRSVGFMPGFGEPSGW